MNEEEDAEIRQLEWEYWQEIEECEKLWKEEDDE
jgi:hypothetical protein